MNVQTGGTSSDQSTLRKSDTLSPWWQNPSGLVGHFYDSESDSRACDWYRIADGFLGIESEDPGLRLRFKQVYGDCVLNSPPCPENPMLVHCRVQVSHGAPAHLVTFTSTEEFDIVGFISALFSDRGYVEIQDEDTDWRSLGLVGKAQPLLTAKGGQVLVNAEESWQPLIANCAINWAMRMQREMLFFHAAAVGIDGAGVLIAGNKGAGKSTLSMALAVFPRG